MEDDIKKWKWKTTSIKNKDGRWPQKNNKKTEDDLKKKEDDLKKN
jgi:hypothetical protein